MEERWEDQHQNDKENNHNDTEMLDEEIAQIKGSNGFN